MLSLSLLACAPNMPHAPVATPKPVETPIETAEPSPTPTAAGEEYEVFPPVNESYLSASAEERELYDYMYPLIAAYEPFELVAAEVGYDKLDLALVVWRLISGDHPEIDDYFMLEDVLDESETVTLSLRADYYYSWDQLAECDLDELRTRLGERDARADAIIAAMPADAAAFDKYLYLAEQVAASTEYDYTMQGGTGISCPYGALITGSSICQGYAKAYQYLCHRVGLYCRFVTGSVGDELHGWNLIRLSDGTYHVDVTFSDNSGEIGSPDWLWYFCMTDEEVRVDHTVDGGVTATGAKYGRIARGVEPPFCGDDPSLTPEPEPEYLPLEAASYANSQLGFSLTLPEDWVGRVTYTETERSVSFFEDYNLLNGWGGLLFSIELVEAEYYDEDVYPMSQVLHDCGDGRLFVAIFPSEAPYDAEDDVAETSYLPISEGAEGAVASFTAE